MQHSTYHPDRKISRKDSVQSFQWLLLPSYLRHGWQLRTTVSLTNEHCPIQQSWQCYRLMPWGNKRTVETVICALARTAITLPIIWHYMNFIRDLLLRLTSLPMAEGTTIAECSMHDASKLALRHNILFLSWNPTIYITVWLLNMGHTSLSKSS